jgi:hypothetical protein
MRIIRSHDASRNCGNNTCTSQRSNFCQSLVRRRDVYPTYVLRAPAHDFGGTKNDPLRTVLHRPENVLTSQSGSLFVKDNVANNWAPITRPTESMRIIDDQNFLANMSMKSDDDFSMVAVATMDDDETEDVPVVARVPIASAVRRESRGLDHTTQFPPESVSARANRISISQLPREEIARSNRMEFDLGQPWQRSLLRELRRIDVTGVVDASKKPELVMLSHSESHDNAIEMDRDNMSIGTNSSVTIPTKSQLIHRSPLNRKQGLFDDEAYVGERLPATPVITTDDNRDEVANGDSSPPRSIRIREDVSPKITKKHIPDVLPRNRNTTTPKKLPVNLRRARAIGDGGPQPPAPPYLEVELSDDADAMAMPDTACGFCWGYNVLDFWLQPNTPQYRRHVRHSRKFSSTQLAEIMEDVDTIDAVFEKNGMSKSSGVSPRDDPIGACVEHH